MSLLILDKNYPECCAIDSEKHIENSLGSPLSLPGCLQEKLSENWAIDCKQDLLQLFELITGEKYVQAYRENTYNQENDLSQDFVFTIYSDASCNDWCWRRDCFVVVEMGSPGDPRYCHYDSAKIYRLEDCCIAESGFLDWHLGWWLSPISKKYQSSDIDWLNDRLTPGFSCSPYYEMTKNCISEPIWNDRKNSFIVKPIGSDFPCFAYPVEPHYGG